MHSIHHRPAAHFLLFTKFIVDNGDSLLVRSPIVLRSKCYLIHIYLTAPRIIPPFPLRKRKDPNPVSGLGLLHSVFLRL